MASLSAIQQLRQTYKAQLSYTDKCMDIIESLSLQFIKSTTVSTAFFNQALLVLQLIPASVLARSEILQKDVPKMAEKLGKFTGTNPLKILGMLKAVSLNLLEAKAGFGKIHTLFLMMAIENRCYHMTKQVIDHPVVILEEATNLGNLLEYLYYSAIILTVFERYEEAAERLESLIKFEKDDSNLREEAEKKLALLYCLITPTKTVAPCKNSLYAEITKKVANPEFILLPAQKQKLTEDGNLGLLRRLKYCFHLGQLKNFSESHIRVPTSSLLGEGYSQIETISNINAIKKLYRYDPIAQCVEFVRPEVDLEAEISKTVKLYLEIKSSAGREKKYRGFSSFGSGLSGLGGLGLGGFGKAYGFQTSSYAFS